MPKKELFPEQLLQAYDAILEPFERIERKGKTMPYTSINGNMFSFIDKE